MKRTVFVAFVVVFLAALLYWWRLYWPADRHTSGRILPFSITNSSLTISGPTPASPAKRQLPGGPYEPLDPRWKWMQEQERKDPSWEWKMPIKFYGRVIDQDRAPIAGASVEFGWTDLSKEGSSQQKTESDQQGLFSLTGKSGKLLQVTITKDGYYSPKEARLRSFEYADFSQVNFIDPDPKRPVIFQLRKKGSGEPLLTGDATVKAPIDGTPVRVDFFKGGRVSIDGQVEISAVTNTEKYPPRFYDWQAKISVPGGGLQEYQDEFPFEAPEAGYTPEASFNFPARETAAWKSVLHKDYYISFGSPPKYARMRITMKGFTPNVHIQYWLNPSGSRNLEPPPGQEMRR